VVSATTQPKLLTADEVTNNSDIYAVPKDCALYVVYQIDHKRQPQFVVANQKTLAVSEQNGYDPRFVKVSELI